MTKVSFSCFSHLIGKKKKYKDEDEPSHHVQYEKLLSNLKQPINSSEQDKLNSTSFSVQVTLGVKNDPICEVKVVSNESPIHVGAAETAYEGEDEHDNNSPIKRDFSDIDLQSQLPNGGDQVDPSLNRSDDFSYLLDVERNDSDNRSDRDAEMGVEAIQSGHVSDPGVGKAEFWASPKLKRSCSNLETKTLHQKLADVLLPLKSQSFDDLPNLTQMVRDEVLPQLEVQASPVLVMTPCSADRVILKKHSSTQVLPSRSRRLWWKLFLWSHRNVHRSLAEKTRPPVVNHIINQQGGYSSDTLEPNQSPEFSMLKSSASVTGDSGNRSSFGNDGSNKQKWDKFHGGISGMWPQNQWVAFSSESSTLTRVDEWVNSLDTQTHPINDQDTAGEGILFPPSPENVGSPSRSTTRMAHHPYQNISEDALHSNSVIQSLNSSSTIAHISGMGLNVLPRISHFSSLRSVNLSGNFVVHITPGSLPKGLHTLNLSRNKIVAIEGLRELTRLRVLDLSYNRISRIGQGLSNCTLIKELFLAGNKISDVEGLHRLLKLTVLDLSFNKISTAKALGQLVANYNSLLALNLLGNPIQGNMSDDQLRKAVSGLLPQLAYLNKQPINPQRAREMAKDGVAKSALGNNGWTSRKKVIKRVTQSGSPSSNSRRNSVGGHKNRHTSKSHMHHGSTQRKRSPILASSH